MKTDKELGEIGAAAAVKFLKEKAYNFAMIVDDRSSWWEQDEPARTAFAAAVREEIFKSVNELPSVEDVQNIWRHTVGTGDACAREIRSYMIAAFAKQLEKAQAKTQHHINVQLEAERDYCEIESKLAAAEKEIDKLTTELDERRHIMAMVVRRMGHGKHGLTNDEIEPTVIKLVERLAAAEKRLEEIAKLPERWKVKEYHISAKSCALVLEAALKPTPTAEEIERQKFEDAHAEEVLVDKESNWRTWQLARTYQETKN